MKIMPTLIAVVLALVSVSAAEAQKAPAPKPQVLCGNVTKGTIVTRTKCKRAERKIGLSELERFDPYVQCRAAAVTQTVNTLGAIQLSCGTSEYLQIHGVDFANNSGLPVPIETMLTFDENNYYATGVRYVVGDLLSSNTFVASVHGVCCDVRY